MAKQETISFMQFKIISSTKMPAGKHLYRLRCPNGYYCPKCGSISHYKITTRNLFECTDCLYQASPTAGTIMDKIHLPLEKWFWGIYFFSTDKIGCSTSQLSKALSITYKLMYMLHKIRKAMKDRDSQYLLKGLIQLDDSFFGTSTQEGSTISSDAYRSHHKLKDEDFRHEAKVFNSKGDSDHLKWLHRIIGTDKAFINGTDHVINGTDHGWMLSI